MTRGAAEHQWTDEEIAKLGELWLIPTITTLQIGQALGLSKNSIVGKAHRLNLPGRESPIKRLGPGEVRRSAPRAAKRLPIPTLPSLSSLEAAVVVPPPSMPKLARLPIAAAKPPAAPVLRNQCCWPLNNGRPWLFCEVACERNYCDQHKLAARGTHHAAATNGDEAARLSRNLGL